MTDNYTTKGKVDQMFDVGIYRDQDTGRSRWAVLETNTYTWYFPTRYGRAAALAYCRKLNKR